MRGFHQKCKTKQTLSSLVDWGLVLLSLKYIFVNHQEAYSGKLYHFLSTKATHSTWKGPFLWDNTLKTEGLEPHFVQMDIHAAFWLSSTAPSLV